LPSLAYRGYHYQYTSAPPLSFVIQRPVDSLRATSVCDPALRLRAAALFIFQGVGI
jgi:hypothetical protein